MSARIDLLYSPGCLIGSVFGVIDVLRMSNRMWRMHHPRKRTVPLSWRVINAQGRELPLPDWWEPCDRPPPVPLRLPPQRTALVVPGVDMRNVPHLVQLLRDSGEAIRIIQEHRRAGGALAALYNGSVLLAHAGVLEQREATVAWLIAGWFARSYPGVGLRMDAPVIVDRDIFSAGAMNAHTELALALVRHFAGEELAQIGANALLYEATRYQQSGIHLSGVNSVTRDSVVYKARQWIEHHAHEPYDLDSLAEIASVSTRTLLRHFREVVGMSPLRYLQKLRVERAKQLLEVTMMDLDSVMEHCGYQDGSAFRRLFQRETGLSPSQYRARYAVRASRRWWRIDP